MAEWTGKAREDVYTALSEGNFKAAVDIVKQHGALKQNDFTPRNTDAIEAFQEHLLKSKKTQEEFAEAHQIHTTTMDRFLAFLYKSLREVPACCMKRIILDCVADLDRNELIFDEIIAEIMKYEGKDVSEFDMTHILWPPEKMPDKDQARVRRQWDVSVNYKNRIIRRIETLLDVYEKIGSRDLVKGAVHWDEPIQEWVKKRWNQFKDRLGRRKNKPEQEKESGKESRSTEKKKPARTNTKSKPRTPKKGSGVVPPEKLKELKTREFSHIEVRKETYADFFPLCRWKDWTSKELGPLEWAEGSLEKERERILKDPDHRANLQDLKEDIQHFHPKAKRSDSDFLWWDVDPVMHHVRCHGREIPIVSPMYWPIVRSYVLKSFKRGVEYRGEVFAAYMILSDEEDSDFTNLLIELLSSMDQEATRKFIHRINETIVERNFVRDWWHGIVAQFADHVRRFSSSEKFSIVLCEYGHFLCILAVFYPNKMDEYFQLFESIAGKSKERCEVRIPKWFIDHYGDGFRQYLHELHEKMITLYTMEFAEAFLLDPFIEETSKTPVVEMTLNSRPDIIRYYFSQHWPHPKYDDLRQFSMAETIVRYETFWPEVGGKIAQSARDHSYRDHEWGAKMACTFPECVQSVGENPLELVGLGLWRTKSSEVRDSIFRLQYLGESGRAPVQEVVRTIEQGIHSDQTAIWNHCAKAIAALAKRFPDVSISCGDRIREIVELDSKYEKTFSRLLVLE